MNEKARGGSRVSAAANLTVEFPTTTPAGARLILVDTSIWIDHLRADNSALKGLLDAGRVLMHPFVIGELALGRMRQRETILACAFGLTAR